MGSDQSVLPHGQNAKEIVWMATHGMTSLEAIRAATVNAAELLGWSDRVGAIAPGRFADIIAVRGNPLRDIQTLEKVAWVMKGGVVTKDALGIAKVQELMAARKAGDEAAASALMAADPRIWFDKRSGPGEPWGLVTKWTHWDDYFHSRNDYSGFREAGDVVTADGTEINDFYRLIERPPQKFRATWWIDASGKVSGFLYEPRGSTAAVEDRFDQFKEWARKDEAGGAGVPDARRPDRPHGRPAGTLPRHSRRMAQGGRPAAGRDSDSSPHRGPETEREVGSLPGTSFRAID